MIGMGRAVFYLHFSGFIIVSPFIIRTGLASEDDPISLSSGVASVRFFRGIYKLCIKNVHNADIYLEGKHFSPLSRKIRREWEKNEDKL